MATSTSASASPAPTPRVQLDNVSLVASTDGAHALPPVATPRGGLLTRMPTWCKPSATTVSLSAVLASSFMFALMAFIVSRQPQFGPFQQSVLRFLVQTAFTVGLVLAVRWRTLSWDLFIGRPANRGKLLSRGLWGATSMLLYFYALTYPGAQLSDVVSILFLNIPLTAVVARFLLGEPYTKYDAATALLSLFGVVLVTQPAGLFGSAAQPTPTVAVLAAMTGAVTSSFAYVTIRRIGPDESTYTVVIWFSAVGCIVSPVAFGVSGQSWAAPTTAGEWAGVLAVGFTAFVGQLLLNSGLQSSPAGPAAAMRYGDVLFSVVFQVAVGVTMNWMKWVGILLVLSSMVAVFAKQRSRAKMQAAARASTAAPMGGTDGGGGATAAEVVGGVVTHEQAASDAARANGAEVHDASSFHMELRVLHSGSDSGLIVG